ncbi:MAG: hypothetical protein EHM58_07290 [Ignavibacteriae bacterium]|nr:MAG: hypothetical protein EHM58_07290 [Ignavibacteriota bacterium]
MGVTITNETIDEYLTSQIDGENRDMDTSNKVNEMLQKDANLMKKYRSEMLTKQLFSSRLSLLEVPSSTFMKVTASIDEMVYNAKNHYMQQIYPIQNSANFFQYLISVLASPLRIGRAAIPAYAFGIAILLIIAGAGILMNQRDNIALNPYIATGSEKSVMVQAVNNFHKVLKGDIQPQFHSSDADEVKKFVINKVNFEPYIPKVEDYVLSGAVCNEYDGQKLVHLVYTSGDDVLYIYETAVNSIHHKRLEIPEQVSSEITKDKFYMCDKVDLYNCTMTLWYSGNVLCASVSTMPKQKMYSTFTSFYK